MEKNSQEYFELPVSLRIRGTIQEVFQAWIDPGVAKDWLCDCAEGEWKKNKTVYWIFGSQRQEIRVVSVEPLKKLKFLWITANSPNQTEIQIEFNDLVGEVGLKLIESKWAISKENVVQALDHACGWENIFCRLKAWVEAKVRLR